MADQSPTALEPETLEAHPISTVARLTGLSVHTIRAWEKRYGVVEPLRTDTLRRVYSREQVRKLSLLRALVDAGHPISSVANLPIPILEQTVDTASVSAPPGQGAICSQNCRCAAFGRVGIVGPSLPPLFESQTSLLPEMELACAWDSLESALEESPSDVSVDLLIVETDALFPDCVTRIRDLAARFLGCRIIVVYGFAPQETVAKLNRIPRFIALRGPVNAEELRLAACRPLEILASPRPEPLPLRDDVLLAPAADRIFSAKQLARLARMKSEAGCECPRHLAQLISSLSAFETYASQCESRNGEDAGLHALLQRATATARREMEMALSKVLELEHIHV